MTLTDQCTSQGHNMSHRIVFYKPTLENYKPLNCYFCLRADTINIIYHQNYLYTRPSNRICRTNYNLPG